jgi:hypothetical protein
VWRIAILGLCLIGVDQASSAPVSFAGRWRLVDAQAPAIAAVELLVGDRPGSRMSIERRFKTGVQYMSLVIGTTTASGERRFETPAGAGFPGIAMRRGDSLVFTALTALDGKIVRPDAHEEVWSLTKDDILIVDVTDSGVGRAPEKKRLSYQRVARPASVEPGMNLLENGAADNGPASWSRTGDTAIEPCGRNPCFAVRNGGTFHQTVILPKDAAGKYVVLVGSGASERINSDNGITGLPTLYAIVGTEDGIRIVAHLQGMLGRPAFPDTWVKMSGVFKIPEDAFHLSFQLNQASARGFPHNGSAARYDDLGVYVFPTEAEARTFLETWRGRAN